MGLHKSQKSFGAFVHFPQTVDCQYSSPFDYINSTAYNPEDCLKDNLLGIDIAFDFIGYTEEMQSKLVDVPSLMSDIGKYSFTLIL